MRWVLGLFCLSLVVIFWVLSSFLVSDLFEEPGVYSKPFFITYLNTSLFTLYLTPLAIKIIRKRYRKEKFKLQDLIHSGKSGSLHGNISIRETIQLSFQFCILWYLANFVTNASLIYTSVSSQTILSTTSSFFTLILGYFANVDTITRTKLFSCLSSFIGIAIIIHSTTQERETSFFGNFLALLGAFFYGTYTILLKLSVKDEARLDTKFFFGFVGIFNMVLIWPTLLIWNWLGVEKFELPDSSHVWLVLGLNCAITFISDYCWAVAVLLTSPLTVTVGLTFTIPLAICGDFMFKNEKISLGYLVGACILCCAFLVLNKQEEELEHEREGHEDGAITESFV